jgi:hypothetical protein
MGDWWTSYCGMELVPCEWAAGGPVVLVWKWRFMMWIILDFRLLICD